VGSERITFQQLVTEELQADMARMHEAMDTAYPMTLFAQRGVGPKSILRELDLDEDFGGCYVLMDGKQPIYVGISRTVIRRLLQHVKGNTHYDASLAYQMACKRCPHSLSRDQAMEDPGFVEAFNEAKSYLESLSVAFVPFYNHVELYLFEVYCSMELGTSEWNSFRTH
jgi:hypothetical protein